jgi:hypothetical protein
VKNYEHRKAKGHPKRITTEVVNKSLPSVNDPSVMNYMEGYLTALLSDAYATLDGLYSKADYTRDCIRLKNRMANENVGFVVKTLPALSNSVFNAIETGVMSFPFLKLKKGTKYPVFLSGLFHLIFNSSDMDYRTLALDSFYSFSVAFKKLKCPYSPDVLSSQYDDFLKVDAEIGNIDLTSEIVKPILELYQDKMNKFIKDIDIDDGTFVPRPGPGATNTPLRKACRYEPHVWYNQIDNVLPYQEWFYPSTWDACLSSRVFLSLYNTRKESPVSRLKFVPKTFGKARGICIEENEMQVLQQAFRRGLTSFIQSSRYKANLPLNDQSVNASLALKASKTLDNATIDMSEASDRVLRDIVSLGFQSNDRLHDALMALSTKYVEAPKEVNVLKPVTMVHKYAPMGSGLCFPVMTLVHFFLIQAIIDYSNIPNSGFLAKQIYVYGDDIVLPSSCVPAVFAYLPFFGMKLNKSKSFYKSHFRESCGIHAHDGQDITPVYVKHTPHHDTLESYISLVNNEFQLYTKHWNITSQYVRDSVLKFMNVPACVRKFDCSQRQGLACFIRPPTRQLIDSQKKYLRKRWNEDLQCFEYRAPRLKKRIETEFISDELHAYLRWMFMHTQDFSSREVGDSSGDLTISWSWVPESALFSC